MLMDYWGDDHLGHHTERFMLYALESAAVFLKEAIRRIDRQR